MRSLFDVLRAEDQERERIKSFFDHEIPSSFKSCKGGCEICFANVTFCLVPEVDHSSKTK